MFEYIDPDYDEFDFGEEYNDSYETDNIDEMIEVSDQNPYQWTDKDPLWQQGWGL